MATRTKIFITRGETQKDKKNRKVMSNVIFEKVQSVGLKSATNTTISTAIRQAKRRITAVCKPEMIGNKRIIERKVKIGANIGSSPFRGSTASNREYSKFFSSLNSSNTLHYSCSPTKQT